MEVKNPLVFLNKRDSSITKTFITNVSIGLVAFAIFSGIASIASAQEEDPETLSPREAMEARQAEIQAMREEQKATLDERREAIATKTAQMREEMEERRENVASRTDEVREQIQERRAVLAERIKDRILALANNVDRKMRAAISRLTQIIGRFEARIVILEERGIDGGAAQNKLNEAKAYLNEAETILDTKTNALVDDTVGGDTPRETWQQAKAEYRAAHTAIRNAHQALREALALLKDAVVDAGLSDGVSDAVRANDTPDDEEKDANASSTNESN